MASVSSQYMINESESNNDKKEAGSVSYNALIYSTALDLTALLIATKKGIDRLPLVYLSEAKA
ncbi:MAG: hypothetical protein C4581_09215 [Nitrospiraceae bacterium]|nr:MAG: hypothetical protein C4581_09215 [Nitrospiraceae bacterium]